LPNSVPRKGTSTDTEASVLFCGDRTRASLADGVRQGFSPSDNWYGVSHLTG